MKVDKIDNLILGILQKNARTPNKKIAELVHLTPPAVTARIKKMEKAGVIEGYSTIINMKKVDKSIMARINLIQVSGTRAELIEFISSNPNILSYENVTGRYSISIKILVSKTTELESLILKLQRFGTTETLIILSTNRFDRSIYLTD